jgi:hypothetical protein
MAFGISGFGAVQVLPSPQIFQALSLGGLPPVPPAPPYGTPNANLVPVTQTGNPALPANLTLASHATFQAILKVSTQSVSSPAVTPVPNTTSAVDATNPSVSNTVVGPSLGALPVIGNPPQGPVSFSLTVTPANVTSGVNALLQTDAQLQSALAPPPPALSTAPQQPAPSQAPAQGQGQPQGGAPASNTPAPPPAPAPASGQSAHAPAPHAPVAIASASIVAKIVATVQHLAVAKVYPGPIFSFSA